MSTSVSSITIREAVAGDKEAVIGIHDNVYDGLDYIAEYFDDFIACPFTTPYVALVKNKIVGFIATFHVDGGETVITRAGRVNPNLGGQGLYKQLNAFVLEASRALRHAFVTSNMNPAIHRESFLSVNKLILSKPFTRFLPDASNLQTLEEPSAILSSPTDKDIVEYFSTPAVKCYLFPRERIIVDWVPFRLIESNIPLLRWSGKRTKVFSDVSFDSDGRVFGLLTFSTTIAVRKPEYCCHFNIYGTDTTTLKDHVISHIRNICDVTNGIICLLVFVEPDFNMEALQAAFNEIGIQSSEWRDSVNPEMIHSKQLVFEKEL